MKLTEHFTLEQMTRSQTATRKNMKEQFAPSEKVIECLKDLCVNILQPLRLAIGKPITVSSGYRCVRLNKAIGGAANSQHVVGQAADIEVEGVTNEEIISAIKLIDLPVDQCIEEFNQWVHISYGPRNRKQFLTASKKAGQTIYTNYQK